MSEWAYIVIGIVIGLAIGGFIAVLFIVRQRARSQNELVNLRARSELLDRDAMRLAEELDRQRQELADINEKREVAERLSATLQVSLREREQEIEKERKRLGEMRVELSDTFTALGSKALAANNQQFLELAKKTLETQFTAAKGDVEKRQQAIENLVKPIKELLEKHNTAVTEIEKKRDVAYRGIEEQIKMIAASHEKLDTQTGKLISALRRPEQRGRWGEMQLRNVVEMAGMIEHCDFLEQPQTDDASTKDRPDMTIRMPNGGVIVVDSKVALDAYLDALDPDANHKERLQAHARQVQDHANRLAGKAYWKQFEHTPDFVVMFMPLEAALHAALQVTPDIQTKALHDHVIITTPTLLVALLQTVAYGWHREDSAANAKQITDAGKELYDRVRIFVEHFENVGKGLQTANKFYNKAVGSLDRNLLTSTRRLKELNATTDEDIDTPDTVEFEVRPFSSSELKSRPEELASSSEA